MKHSTVLIAVQPLEINRTNYFASAGEEKEFSQARHMFGKLNEIMKVSKLRHVMRTTVEINNLIELTQSYLNNKTNQYNSKIRNYSEESEKSAAKKSFPKLRKESSKAINNTENMPKLFEEIVGAQSSNPHNIATGFSSTFSINASPVYSEEIIDFDELYKVASTPSKKNKTKLHKVITKFRYPCDSEIGHGINGPLPKLIKLKKASHPCETIFLIEFLLLEIINIKSKKVAIIHFDKNEPDWFQILFKVTSFFSGVTVTNNVPQFLQSSSNIVLVNNYNCVKGLEFSEVLLILDADEYHLKQFIPEAMARCLNNLAIFVRPKTKENLKSDTVKDLVDHWEVSNEMEKPVLEIISLEVCSGYAFKKHENYKENHCKTEKSKYSSYKIHKKCERYKELSKIVKSSYRNLHLDDKKISKEEEAM